MDSFGPWYKIKMLIYSESPDVFLNVDDNLGRVPLEKINNCDWTSNFFHVVLCKSFVQQGEASVGTKMLKECVIVLLTCSTISNTEKLWFVGKAKNAYTFSKYASDPQKAMYL